MKIIFFGTPLFAAHILDFLKTTDHEILAVVTRPDRPRGRSQKLLPSAVKALTCEKWPDLPLLQPEKVSTETAAEALRELGADLYVVVAYGEIIKTNILDIPPKGCINIHASLLPKYRGAAPMQRCLMDGETETGITIMEMVLKMDAGAMLDVEKVAIPHAMTFGELEEKLCDAAKVGLARALEKIETNTLVATPQDESKVTFASKISFEDRILDWSRSASDLHNQVRDLSPFPGTFCFALVKGEKKRLIIKKAVDLPDCSEDRGEPGKTLKYAQDQWVIQCGVGALSLLEVQLEGKKAMAIGDFIRGNPTPPTIAIA